MGRETRRQFLVRSTAAGTLALGSLRGQNREPVLIPGLEAGESTTSFALWNVAVIDVIGGRVRPQMTVVITGNRIQSMGVTGTTELAPGVQVEDGSGKFLIPGLWDMHAHAWLENPSPLFIPNGVTGVRMMGGIPPTVVQLIAARREIAGGKRLGPRMLVGSRTINPLNGARPETVVSWVQTDVQSGADFIKVHNGVSRESYFAIVAEAKRLGVPVVGHVPRQPPNPMTLEECAEAGQRSFEHMAGVHEYLTRMTGAAGDVRAESLSAAQAEALFDIFRKNRAWLCPTLVTSFGLSGDPSLSQQPGLRYLDDDTKTLWARVFKNPNLPGARERSAYNLELVGAMHKGGVNILAGTDTGLLHVGSQSDTSPYCLPGFSLHDELGQMVSAGLSALDALRTATLKPAEFLGLLDSLGTLEQRKLAEMVLLDANPLDDIANTRRINMVFTGGRVYRRKALDAMLNAIELNARN